mgnify:CR=1 FL=1
MTILAYILALFTIGWGREIVGLVFMPLIMAAMKSPVSHSQKTGQLVKLETNNKTSSHHETNPPKIQC